MRRDSSAMLGGRLLVSFSRQCRMMSSSSADTSAVVDGRGAGSKRTLARISCTSLPSKGVRPVTIWYRITPSE